MRVFVRVISIFLGRDKCSHLHEDFSDKALHKQWVLYFSLVDVEILGFLFGLCECQWGRVTLPQSAGQTPEQLKIIASKSVILAAFPGARAGGKQAVLGASPSCFGILMFLGCSLQLRNTWHRKETHDVIAFAMMSFFMSWWHTCHDGSKQLFSFLFSTVALGFWGLRLYLVVLLGKKNISPEAGSALCPLLGWDSASLSQHPSSNSRSRTAIPTLSWPHPSFFKHRVTKLVNSCSFFKCV